MNKSNLLDVLKTILTSLVFVFIFTHMFGLVTISGQSMYPSLHDGENVILNKATYVITDPKQNDVVVFLPPIAEKEYFIKRIIATPHHTVEIKDYKVYVDGKIIDEPYISEPMNTKSMPEVMLLDGEFFVLGDNRNASMDSRDFGPIRENAILGKLFNH